jgi:tripartite-type tricarboxylate transporter receptor subunit TctC
MKRIMAIWIGMFFVFSFSSGNSIAAAWPEKTITAFCGWAAGGTSDIATRALALEMEKKLGVKITATNMLGALGSIGATHIAKSAPDGYTWFGGAAVHGTWPVLKHASISWTNFYAFLSNTTPTTIYVKNDAPWKTIEELLVEIKANPGKLKYGHPGAGSNGRIFGDLVLKEAGLLGNVIVIPYKGGREAGKFLLAGDIHFASVSMGDVTDWAAGKLIRPIANLYNKPIIFEGVSFRPVTEVFPKLAFNIPINPFFGLYIHRNTPDDIVVKIAEAFLYAVGQERFKKTTVKERAMFIDPLIGIESDKMMSKVESARSWPLFELGVAPVDPSTLGIPKIEDWKWPPHERAKKIRPWPEKVEKMFKEFRVK